MHQPLTVWRAWLLACALGSASAAAAFEQPADTTPALRCLVPKASELKRIEYPSDELKRKDSGSVHVELKFVGADAPPEVKVIEGTFNLTRGALVQAVLNHVKQFRVPCLTEQEAPVSLRQEYVFIPNDGRKVVSSLPTDAASAKRNEMIGCVRHVDGELKPTYPRRALERNDEGKVLALMVFSKPDAPPELTLIDGSRSPILRFEVERHAAGLRMPCLQDVPVRVPQLFAFSIEGGRRVLLKDMPLLTLLKNASHFPQPVYFDFTNMGCPFEVRLTYYQPHFYNRVQEIEQSLPQRRAFLDWLAQIDLKVSTTSKTALYGETSTITVPCGSLDL